MPQTFQQSFLARLQTQFTSRSEMVQSLGETLGVGRDAIYRRLRGDTILTADELIVLARKYRVIIDDEPQLGEIPQLCYQPGNNMVTGEYEYFLNLRKHTEWMVGTPGIRVDYATPELPIFYELAMPTLRAFKVYIFGVTTWNLKKWEKADFCPGLISPETTGLIEDLIADTYRLPGRELWSISILDVTLRQINYMAQLGRFAEETYLEMLFSELHQIVDHLERMTRSGKRFPIGGQPRADSPTFQVYHNELSNTNSAIIVHSKARNVMFSTLINPNYVMTDDPRVLKDVQQWFERLVAGGNALNAEAGKYTSQYFAHLRQQIETARHRAAVISKAF